MNYLDNMKDYLTCIITNDDVQDQNGNHIFLYRDKDNKFHTDTITSFLEETNINLNNDWYYTTALELAKMGHMILFNVGENLLIISPSKNRLSKFQKNFQCDIKNISSNFPFVENSIYDENTDDFIYCQDNYKCGYSYTKTKNNRS